MLSPWTVTAKALSKYLLITKLSKMSVNNSLKFGIGLFLSLFLMVACQKEQDVTPQLEEANQKVLPYLEGVELIENRLVFKSEDAYKSIQRLLREKGVDEEAIIKNQFPDFISMEDAYNNISDEERLRIGESGDLTGYENLLRFERGTDGEISAEVNTEIFESRLLVNPQGIIQIGDNFWKIEYKNTYNLSKEQFDKFMITGKVNDFLNKRENKVIVLGETGVSNSNARASHKCDASTGSNKRVRGVTRYSSGDIEVVSKHQKKVAFTWWRNQAVYLAFGGTVSWDSGFYGNNQSWSSFRSCNNCNRTSQVITNEGWTGGSVSNVQFDLNHIGQSDNTASCKTVK